MAKTRTSVVGERAGPGEVVLSAGLKKEEASNFF